MKGTAPPFCNFKKRKKGPELDKNKIILVGLAALLLIGAYIGVSKFISPVADSGPEIAKSEPAFFPLKAPSQRGDSIARAVVSGSRCL